MNTQTPDIDTELARAESALAEARGRKSVADAIAAEEARLADPLERAIDAADAGLLQARNRGAAAVKSASAANTALSKATAAVRALAEAAAAGDAPEEQALVDALQACREAEGFYAFHADVQAIAQGNVERAIEHAAGTRDARQKGRLVAAQQRLNDEFRALVPNQPDDAALKAELARNPNWLGELIRGAGDAHRAAYSHWAGSAAQPLHVPRQRVIAERTDFGSWVAWSVAPEAGLPAGWQERALIRQIRCYLAAIGHFGAYKKLGLDDLRRLHAGEKEYWIQREKLPRWNNFKTTGSNDPMIAPGCFVKAG